MANSVVQTIRDAEVDARSLSEFVSKGAYFAVTRRLAPTIHTLDYYLLVLNRVKEKGDLADIAISDTLDKLDQLEPTVIQRVEDAINNTAVEGGVLADTFVVVDGSLSQRTINKGLESIADLSTINNPKDGLRVYVKSYHTGLNKGGGYFTYDSSKSGVNDGGVIINGWVREGLNRPITPQDFGAVGNGVVDDTLAIQTAINNSNDIYIPEGVYLISSTIKTKSDLNMRGAGRHTVFQADNIDGPAILTYSGVGQGTAPNQDIGSFTVGGTADCAVAFAHCTVSNFSDIHLSPPTGKGTPFSGRIGFCFEYLWSSHFSRLYTNGAGPVIPFLVGKVVLDSIFDLLYTGNRTEYNVIIDSGRQEFSTGEAFGYGLLTFNNLTVQLATKYGLYIKAGSNIQINNLYSEATNGALRIDYARNVTFNGGSFNIGDRTNPNAHAIYIEGKQLDAEGVLRTYDSSHIAFNNCDIAEKGNIVIGYTQGPVSFNQCRSVLFHGGIKPLIQRTKYAHSGMPLFIQDQTSNNPTFIIKTEGFGHKMAEMSPSVSVVDGVEVGVWKQKPTYIIPLTEIVPND